MQGYLNLSNVESDATSIGEMFERLKKIMSIDTRIEKKKKELVNGIFLVIDEFGVL